MAPTAELDVSRQPAWLVLEPECDAARLHAELRVLGCGERVAPAADAALFALVDFRRVDLAADGADALALADALAPATRFLRPTLALLGDETQTRRLRLVAALAALRGAQVRSFDDFEQALAWLRGDAEPVVDPRPSFSLR